jgi:D-serine deaminase-like pyridoxal phosphate-dependent protein
MRIDDLDTPCVLIDLERVEQNLRRAQGHADEQGYALRPHTKTHKLPRFAKRQVELGSRGITVQKLGEAEVMADAGLDDIFLPYNIIGPIKLARLKALNERITIRVTADSAATVDGYAEAFADGKPLTVLVECDTGAGRVGVQSPEAALALARRIVAAPGLRFGGLMTYPKAGNITGTITWLMTAAMRLSEAGIDVPVITAGNSPDIWMPADNIVTERRPGTYIYNDRMQLKAGSAKLEHCALTVLATVVSRPTPTRAVIDAGSKSLSSDQYGIEGFGVIYGTDAIVTSLSEEHGVITLPEASDIPRVGDRVRILPNHCCVVSNLFDAVHLIDGNDVVAVEPVAARGRVA